MREIRDVFETGIGEICAGHLSAALEQMSGQGSSRKCIPILVRPAKLVE